jgi:hypothetical protein
VLESVPKLAPWSVYFRRQGIHLAIAVGILVVGLGIGIAGYHWIAGLGWVDSLLNASMILGGMGPVDVLKSRAAKIFASGYALFAGLLFMVTMGIVVAPMAHRLIHRLHLDETRRNAKRKEE